MTRANDLVRKAVKVDRSRRPRRPTIERPEPLGPPTSLVLRSSTASPATPPGRGVDRLRAWPTGSPTPSTRPPAPRSGRRPVGLSSPVLARSRSRAIPRSSSSTPGTTSSSGSTRATGRLIWRLGLGEAVESPPLVLGDQLFQVLPSGKLLVIACRSGELRRRSTWAAALPDAGQRRAGRFLYVVGQRGLPVRPRPRPARLRGGGVPRPRGGLDPLHPGPGRPVPDRRRERSARRIAAGGCWSSTRRAPRSGPVQQVDVPGWTWATPASSGSVVWAAGDRGGVEAYAARRLREQEAASARSPGSTPTPPLRARRSAWRARSASSGSARPVGPVRAGPRARRAHAAVRRWPRPARRSPRSRSPGRSSS